MITTLENMYKMSKDEGNEFVVDLYQIYIPFERVKCVLNLKVIISLTIAYFLFFSCENSSIPGFVTDSLSGMDLGSEA